MFPLPLVQDGETKDSRDEASKGCGVDEIVSVLAHELGHWSYSHTLKNISMAEVSDWASELW